MANEKRLIDANVLADKVDESKYHNPHPQVTVRVNHRNEHDHFLKMIMDAPTVDAVEVVHARWVVKGQDIFCSNCDSESEYNAWGASSFSTYCPNCGAKMDGSADNEID